MGHQHQHSQRDRSRTNRARLKIVLAVTTVYMLAEVAGGLLTGSLALLADAGHMLTDVGGVALALLAMKFAERPSSPEKTYGYYRVEILAALTNAIVLIGISLGVLYEAYQRFRNPPQVESTLMLAVAGIGLVVNVVSVLVLRSGTENSLNMKGAYFEVLSDLITSVGVMVAGVIMLTTNWYLVDPILSAGIGLFIFPRTWKLLKEAVDVLLEGTPTDVNIADLREAMGKVPGVAGVHDLHVWSLTSGMNAMSAHVVIADQAVHEAVLSAVREHVTRTFKIGHVTIQIEQRNCNDTEAHL